jgi:hypothetical protein
MHVRSIHGTNNTGKMDFEQEELFASGIRGRSSLATLRYTLRSLVMVARSWR